MRKLGKWFGITLCALFVLTLVAAAGVYFLSDHRILVGQYGP